MPTENETALLNLIEKLASKVGHLYERVEFIEELIGKIAEAYRKDHKNAL